MSVSDIPEKVRYLLWAKSAGRCEYDGCNRLLYRDGLTQIEMNFADVAHIIGDSPDGPRGDAVLSSEYCSDVSNLMLMCQDHHRMIDQITSQYSDEDLRQMKRTHEDRMEILTGMKADKTSQILIYSGRVGDTPTRINYRDASLAIFPEWYPASRHAIELGLGNTPFADHEEKYWNIEVESLERQFARRVVPVLENSGERNHFSVFAFAPQPLLIKLGSLLTDVYPAEVYQLHREPATWKWQPGPEEFGYRITEPTEICPNVVLNLSLSADITSQRIQQIFGDQPFSEWRFSIGNPGNDFLKSQEQLQLFRQEFRSVLNTIKAKHGEKTVIHIFPAVPVSIAVEIGRVRQPKADLPFIIYDQNNKSGRFIRALSIGEPS
jgi:hypothetical protein